MGVVIHIGYPKTASTWLQEQFFPAVKNFHFESWQFTNRIFRDTDFFTFDAESIKEEIYNRSRNNNILLSSEHLTTAINSGWHSGHYSAAIAQKIHQTFPQATIIIFIRRQDSLICSAYQQYIKNGGTFGFKRWFRSGEVFSPEHLFFDKLIDYYDTLFGQGNVQVYLYEEFRKNRSDFLRQLANKNRFDVDFDSLSYSPVNKGLRKGLKPLLQSANYFYLGCDCRKHIAIAIPGMRKLQRAAIRFLNPIPLFGDYLTESDILSEDDYQWIRNTYSKTNNNLANRLGKEKLTTHGYPLQ